jgi:pimeloyl-ACP methyl ester carboxylesterase
LNLDSIALVGHSLGAHTASLIAQCQPDRVTRLVLEDPPAPPRDASSKRDLSTIQVAMLAMGTILRRRRYDPAALASAIRELRVPDPVWWQRLSLITAPTLVISGGDSSHLAPQRVAGVARAIADAELVTIPVGHRVHSLAPDRFGETVVPFLTR